MPLHEKADIRWWLRPSREGHLVQRVLDNMAPWDDWEEGAFLIETHKLVGQSFTPTTVEITVSNAKIVRGIHVEHTARKVGLSPFVDIPDEDLPKTNLLTVEIAGSPESPIITRAYPGDYVPPLPWMGSARQAYPDGRQTCEMYWRNHAYPISMMKKDKSQA